MDDRFPEKLAFALSHPFKALYLAAIKLPCFKFIRETQGTQTPVTFKMWFTQKVLGFDRKVYWPVHFTSRVTSPQNVLAGVETCPGYMPGCYIQGGGKIYIGDYTQIGPNVGVISANHDLFDNRIQIRSESVTIGRYCWLGMNCVILPGVQLGDFTIVGAGSVVTKSFPQGHCVIAGNPARLVRLLDQDQCIEHRSPFEYHGYIPAARFASFRKKRLNV
jgi:acetyltransferase-like isoleucine patch superfamily enzyme